MASRRRDDALLIIASVVLLVVAATFWNWYDIEVFTSWYVAFKLLGLSMLYRAPIVFGERFRVVYPPLAPLLFISSYALGTQVAVAASKYLANPFLLECLLKAVLKLPIVAVVLGLALWFRRRYNVKAALYWILGVPVVITVALYNFDVIVAVLAFAAVLLASRKRYDLSSIALALATLFKQTAALVLPVILLDLKPRTRIVRYLLVYAAVLAFVLAPFAYASGVKAVVEWMLLFHSLRPPQGTNPWSIAVLLTGFDATVIAAANEAWWIAFAASYLAVLYFSERAGLRLEEKTAIVILLYLLLGKVVNPVYLAWAYPFIVQVAAERKDWRLAKLYNVVALVNGLYFALPRYAAAVIGAPVLFEDEMKMYPARKILEESLNPVIASALIGLGRLGPLYEACRVLVIYQFQAMAVMATAYLALASAVVLRIWRSGRREAC